MAKKKKAPSRTAYRTVTRHRTDLRGDDGRPLALRRGQVVLVGRDVSAATVAAHPRLFRET